MWKYLSRPLVVGVALQSDINVYSVSFNKRLTGPILMRYSLGNAAYVI